MIIFFLRSFLENVSSAHTLLVDMNLSVFPILRFAISMIEFTQSVETTSIWALYDQEQINFRFIIIMWAALKAGILTTCLAFAQRP